MKFKIKFMDQIVGLFIIIAFLLLGLIIALLGINQRWFAKDYHFWTLFSSANGVSPGTEITMKGFVVGKIDKVSLNEDNMVLAVFHIFDKYYPLVIENSVLELTVSPIGLGSSLLFHPGRAPMDPFTFAPIIDPETGEPMVGIPLAEGSYIPSTSTLEGQAILEDELADIPIKDDTITRLLSNINPLIENINKVAITLNRTLTEVNRSIAGESSGPLGGIIGDVHDATSQLPEITARILDFTDEINEFAANLTEFSNEIKDPTGLVPKLLDPKGSIATILDDGDTLYKSLINIIGSTEEAVRKLSAIISSLNNEMPKVASLLNETRTAIKQAQDVMEGVSNNPLIKGGISERNEQGVLYGSMREDMF